MSTSAMDAQLDLRRQMTDVRHGALLHLTVVAVALPDKGRDDTVPVLDPLDVHLGRYRSEYTTRHRSGEAQPSSFGENGF